MIARRSLLQGAAALPIAAVLADPLLSRAEAAMMATESLTTIGGKKVSAHVARPEGQPTAVMILIHEWWGLNDQIRAMASEFARLGYLSIAVDLYDGKVATQPADARAYMGQVNADEATDTLNSWIDWGRAQAGADAKVGTVGWCFGGGWSLAASLSRPVDATIVYYGNVARSAEELARLKSPVLGHFAESDQWINHSMVDGFEAAMKQAGKTFTSHWYEAQHGFANPTTARYDEADARAAWDRTKAFLAAHLS